MFLFESTVTKLNKQMQFLQKKLTSDQSLVPTEKNSHFIMAKCTLIRGLIDTAGAIINGNIPAALSPVAVSTIQSDMSAKARRETSDVIEVSDGGLLDQSDIDALFD